ncbi:MAG: HU family DNA-binding protein [Deltaproteobacteria bacterium]|nr:HU family DNA-binding protein [Deltaproteobacteria bacterium]
MTLTKDDIARSVVENVRFKRSRKEKQRVLFPEFDYDVLPIRRAVEIVDTLFEILKRSLEKGQHVLISGFGKFQVTFKWARKGRNPRTGKPMILDPRRVVQFRCSIKLKDALNNEKGRRE